MNFISQKFKVGDRVEVIPSPCTPAERVGERGVVVEAPNPLPIPVRLMFALAGSDHRAVAVRIHGNHHIFCANSLRKIDERGDWKQIERETGYTPPVAVPA